jgi:protease YdgD
MSLCRLGKACHRTDEAIRLMGMEMKLAHVNCRALVFSIVICQLILAGALASDGALAQPAPSGLSTGILNEKDRRVQISSDQWPWSSLGRINVIAGYGRGLCTGTLIAPRRVLTAAQCLFNDSVNGWVKPSSVHFLIGQEKDKFLGHSIVETFVIAPEFAYKLSERPRFDMIDPKMVRHNWAILTLRYEVTGKPVPILAIEHSDLPSFESAGQFALAGYASDREYVLSVHKGCTIMIDASEPGLITHMCDTFGQIGAPILLLSNGSAKVIGIHASLVQDFEPNVGWKTLKGVGVSASEFGQFTVLTRP